MHIRELAIKVADYLKEKPELYYVPPLHEGQHQKISKGIFVDRYRNNRRDCIKSGLLTNKKCKVNNRNVEQITSIVIDETNIERKSIIIDFDFPIIPTSYCYLMSI